MCCHDDVPQLTFEMMLSDPLIRLVMESDGVTQSEMIEVLVAARAATVGIHASISAEQALKRH